MDGQRGRIALNTALLEQQPGELLIAKDQLMAEAAERASRARSLLQQREQQREQDKRQDQAPAPAQEEPSGSVPSRDESLSQP